MSQRHPLRKKKFIDPRIQKRFALLFVAIASAAVVVESVVLQFALRRVARELPTDGARLLEFAPEFVLFSGVLTFAILAPIAVLLGVRATFPLVGPIFRFRQFMGAVLRGEQVEACRIRKTDELQDVCELLNQVTEEQRARNDGSETLEKAA